ncbi:hypothetical protein P879_01169 [Paragonimus westermani]|uniref:RRM domain-containing protein n=1 Tax=Paragonimus westermani TaxID=34504 RepID=A0A8T0DTY5_9TREM|nr:hypothetical protein P879_01169 [Paragonimus westermani]
MVVYHDRNLIINYIPRNLSDVDLSNLFSSVGTIKTCRIIRDRSSGSSFGFGFCEYEDAASAHRAIERFNGYRIEEKILKVSMAKLQGKLYQSSNLYVKKFPISVTEEQLLTEFSRFGKVLQCRILRDRETDESKGSAYVLFENRSDAVNARNALDGCCWPSSSDGQPLSIKFATPPYRQPSFGNASKLGNIRKTPTIYPNSSSVDCDQLAAQLLALQSRVGLSIDPYLALSQPLIHGPAGAPQNTTLPGTFIQPPFVSQMQTSPQSALWTPEYAPPDPRAVNNASSPLTAAYISPYYLTPHQVLPNFWPTHPNPSTGSFCPTFANQFDGLMSAVHGFPVVTGLQSLFPSSGQFPNPGLHGIASDLTSVKDLRTTKFEKLNSSSVYAYNIGYLMTEQRLWELFSRFGTVLSVSVPRDPKTNLTRNFGFVTFDSFQSAKNAIITLNGLTMDGRRLQVSFRKPKTANHKVGNGNSLVNGADARTDAKAVPLTSVISKVHTDKVTCSPTDLCTDMFSSLHLGDVSHALESAVDHPSIVES